MSAEILSTSSTALILSKDRKVLCTDDQVHPHTVTNPISKQKELDEIFECSTIWFLTCDAAWIPMTLCSFIDQRRTGPGFLFLPRFFFSFCHLMEFGFIATVTSGLLSWGHWGADLSTACPSTNPLLVLKKKKNYCQDLLKKNLPWKDYFGWPHCIWRFPFRCKLYRRRVFKWITQGWFTKVCGYTSFYSTVLTCNVLVTLLKECTYLESTG